MPDGTAEDVDRAATAAAKAFESWSRTTPEERAKFCTRIAEGLQARVDEIATVVTREAGMPKWLSQIVQAGLPINSFNTAAATAESFPYEEQIGNSLVVREPVGVVGAITPWNYPLHQIAAKVAYAMAAGCTVVLKPSEVAPLDAYILAEVIDDAGLPGRRVQPRLRHRAGRRQRHQQPPPHRHGLVHRLDRAPARRSPPTPPPRSSGWPSSWAASRPTSSSTTSTRRAPRRPCATASARPT